MQEYIKQINILRGLSGNAQLDYLASIKSEMLYDILDYTYNPHKMYKVDEAKLALVTIRQGLIKRKKKTEMSVDEWITFTEMLDKLADKRAANLNDVKELKYFITGYSSLDVQQFLSQIVAKDLRLNLGIKKIQTVWPDFCNYGQVQLAEDYAGQDFVVGRYSRKFDGKRMLIENGIAKSRYGKRCKEAPIQHILDELQEISQGRVFDGELLYFDPYGNEDFQKVISLSGSDLRSVDCLNIYYVIFDMLVYEDWVKQSTEVIFDNEYEKMIQVLQAKNNSKFGYSVLDTKFPHILLARQEYDDHVFQCERLKNKWEGLMYRNACAPYEFKRSKNLMKIKDMKDGEFKILGYGSGSGRNINRLGKIYIDFKGNKVGVGSGFTDEDRDLIWVNLHSFVDSKFGDIFDLKVQYFNETKDANGNDSLRFPVFLCFRHKETKEEFTPKQALEFFEKLNKKESEVWYG